MKKYQSIAIGFGGGDRTLAKALASKGESVLVVEKLARMYGGTCTNIGCIPSRSLIFNGERRIDFTEAVARKEKLTGMLRTKNYHMINDKATGAVIDGVARFLFNHQIEVTNNGGKVIVESEQVFIDTGSEPIILPIKGLNASRCLIDSTQAVDREQLPEKLVITGTGYIGLESASMLNGYGPKVVVLDVHPEFLPREGKDVTRMILGDLTNAGTEFHLGMTVDKVVNQESTAAVVSTEDGQKVTIKASKVLAVTGRKANTASFGLENIDIKLTSRGAIAIDEYPHTDAESIWTIGDVKGGLQFAYISLDDYRIIMDQLKGENIRTMNNRRAVPYSVFTTPTLSDVGLTERQAKAQGVNYKLFKYMTSGVPKTQILEDPGGIFKVLVDPETGLILGASIYVEDSHEVINLIPLAINGKLPYTLLRDQIYSHPTMGEALNGVLK